MPRGGSINNDGSDTRAAIPAGLNRILADCVVLHYIAQMARWRLPVHDRTGFVVLLSGLTSQLDQTAWETAARIRALGKEPESDLVALVQLASCRASDPSEQPPATALSIAVVAVVRDFRTMEQIARESDDEVTARLLAAHVIVLEGSVGQFWTAGDTKPDADAGGSGS